MRRGVFRFLESSGLNRAWSARRRGHVTILRYHGVVEDDWAERASRGQAPRWPLPGPLTRSAFRSQLETIGRRHRIISLDDAFAMLTGTRSMRPGCVVLTFDDGYRNNATTAFEVLRDCSATAAFFLTTDFVDGVRPMWFDRLEYACGAGDGALPAPLHPEDGRRGARAHSPVHALDDLKQSLKRLDHAAIDCLVTRIEAQTGRSLADVWLEDERSAPMTWEQARMLRRAGMTIGAHTLTHQILTAVDAETARDEVTRSKRRIEEELGEPCRYFAYPNGSAADFSKGTRQMLIDAGYSGALTTIEGTARRGDDPFALRRVAAGKPIDPDKLLAQLSGLLPAALRARDSVRRAASMWRGRANRRPADAVGD